MYVFLTHRGYIILKVSLDKLNNVNFVRNSVGENFRNPEHICTSEYQNCNYTNLDLKYNMIVSNYLALKRV
jgi:hypothetical protein